MSKIIVNDVESQFKHLTTKGKSGPMMKTALIEKDSLPNSIKRKMSKSASANVKMGTSSFYHPLFQSTNMMLPRDRRERNEWCRHFYRTEPIIATAIDMHTEYPISDFSNVCSDPDIKKFFDYMAFDKLNINQLLLDIGHEYWKIGDVFPFGQLNENDGIWDKFTLLNADYIDMQSNAFAEDPIIQLIPDSQIISIVNSGPTGEYADIYKQLPAEVVRAVREGKNIPLDNRLVFHIAHKASQYELWGTPTMMRCFKTLIYKDKLRQAQNAIADRHIMPLRVAKIGSPGEPMPTQEDIDDFRDTLLQADGDPNFFIVYHYGLSFDYVGSTGKILPLNTEFDFIQKELMNGLGINEAMLNGDGPTYANAQVGFNALAHRYMSYRLMLENWIRYRVYKPIAEIQGFYKSKNGEINVKYMSANMKKQAIARNEMDLIIPTISWQQQDLSDNQSIMSFIQKLFDDGRISMKTVLPMLKLDPETEKRNLEEERGTVFDKNAPDTGPLPNETMPNEEILNNPKPPVEGSKKEVGLNDFFQKSEQWEPKMKTVVR